MASNYDYHNQNFRPNRTYHPKKYTNPKEPKKYPQQSTIREVEINSITQTEPSKPKQIIQIDETNHLPLIDQGDIVSKTNDETPNITALKQDFIVTDDYNWKDINDQLHTIVSKLEELDIDKKVNEITQLLNNKCDQIKKENQEEIKKVKAELEQDIIEAQNAKDKDIKEIKALLSWECLNQLRDSLINLKGEYYSKPEIITSVYQFERYYDKILSKDIREKYISTMTIGEIISIANEKFNGKNSNSLEQKFWSLVRNFKGKSSSHLKLSLSGSVYRIIRHFRGLPDDIVIEFGDLQPVLTEKMVEKAKKSIYIVVNLIYEILINQIPTKGSKIFAYGHIYYGKQAKGIEIKELVQNNIYYDFVQLS